MSLPFLTPVSRHLTLSGPPLSDPEHAIGRIVTGYFAEREWFSSNPDGVRSRVADHHRMLSTYLNQLAAAGFVLERTLEPGPSARQAERVPGNREVPTLLLIRAQVLKESTDQASSKGRRQVAAQPQRVRAYCSHGLRNPGVREGLCEGAGCGV